VNILFIRPEPPPETIGLRHVMLMEPLELEVLAATVRSHDNVHIVDMILEKKPFEQHVTAFKPDIVCLTGYITHVTVIKRYCRRVKTLEPACRTIVGGVHCEVCPEDFDDDTIDYRVVRNATSVFPKLLDHIESAAGRRIEKHSSIPGVLVTAQQSRPSALPPFDFSMPFPRREFTRKYRHRYFYIFHENVALIKTSFGCPGQCSFCFCRIITAGKYAQRPLDEVIQELRAIAEKNIYIVDDDFLADKERVERFIDRCVKENIRKEYLIYGRADFIAAHPETIRKFKTVGLRTVIVGFESFSDEDLRRYNKKSAGGVNKSAIAVLREYDVDCYATIILPPHWKRSDFRSSTRTLTSLGIHYVNLQPLTPLPRTGVVCDPSQLLVNCDEYGKWDLAHVTIRPKYLSVADFYRELLRMYSAILFRPRVLLRYLVSHPLRMNIRLLIGSLKVRKQYRQKILEARHNNA
jgi:hopanoid C-3 methylase